MGGDVLYGLAHCHESTISSPPGRLFQFLHLNVYDMGNFCAQDTLTFCKAGQSTLLASTFPILIHYLAAS